MYTLHLMKKSYLELEERQKIPFNEILMQINSVVVVIVTEFILQNSNFSWPSWCFITDFLQQRITAKSLQDKDVLCELLFAVKI